MVWIVQGTKLFGTLICERRLAGALLQVGYRTTPADPFSSNVEHYCCVQVEHADSDSSICDVTLQGSPSDCCTAVLQILHHASASYAQSNDWTRKDIAQAAWQIKHQVSFCHQLA